MLGCRPHLPTRAFDLRKRTSLVLPALAFNDGNSTARCGNKRRSFISKVDYEAASTSTPALFECLGSTITLSLLLHGINSGRNKLTYCKREKRYKRELLLRMEKRHHRSTYPDKENAENVNNGSRNSEPRNLK